MTRGRLGRLELCLVVMSVVASAVTLAVNSVVSPSAVGWIE